MRSFDFARDVKTGKRAYPDARLPEYSTRNSAGADFFCAEEVVIRSIWREVAMAFADSGLKTMFDLLSGFVHEDSSIKPTMVHTGIKASMYDDEVLKLYNRSGNPKKGLILANGVGVVDADYFENESNDGEIMFAFINYLPWDVTIRVGDRIGQGVFEKFLRPESGLNVKDETRSGGFGSTGN